MRRVAREAELLQQFAGSAGIVGCNREQEMLNRDIFVLQSLGFVLRLGEAAGTDGRSRKPDRRAAATPETFGSLSMSCIKRRAGLQQAHRP